MQRTYNRFLGRITKHQRVQMAPVATRAKFWDMESFSGEMKKLDTPARTTPH